MIKITETMQQMMAKWFKSQFYSNIDELQHSNNQAKLYSQSKDNKLRLFSD